MFKIEKIKIPKDEVLRYLGYKEQKLSIDLENLIDATIDEAENLMDFKYTYSKHKTVLLEDGVLMEGTNLILKGQDIKEHLKYAKDTVLMAATLGGRIEKQIRLYEKINLTKALILDSCATAAIEEGCDKIEECIKEEEAKEGLSITFRFSPGYGDLPLSVQKEFLNALNAEKIIGLTASEHQLLLPRKSVTAIIGLIPKEKAQDKKGCEVCKNYENCSFRREGIICGH